MEIITNKLKRLLREKDGVESLPNTCLLKIFPLWKTRFKCSVKAKNYPFIGGPIPQKSTDQGIKFESIVKGLLAS